jgi:hypothetical protein
MGEGNRAGSMILWSATTGSARTGVEDEGAGQRVHIRVPWDFAQAAAHPDDRVVDADFDEPA